MQNITAFVDFVAIAVVMSFLGFRVLLFWSDQFEYADNLQVKAKLQQLRFLYQPFINPCVAGTAAIAVVLLNVVAYWMD